MRLRRSWKRVCASSLALQELKSRDMNLQYAPDGQTLQHALIDGDAVIRFAGDRQSAGRQITASSIDIGLAPDGTTPIAEMMRALNDLLASGKARYVGVSNWPALPKTRSTSGILASIRS